MMNQCAYEQNAFVACEEMRRKMKSVVCPKPRRIGTVNIPQNESVRPMGWCNQQTEICYSSADTELLDILLAKGGYGAGKATQMASSPPFFFGSPPSRVSNPVIQDAQFCIEKCSPVSPTPPSPSSSSRVGGGCVRVKFGQKPAAVRIEGFDCLNRDLRNCSISAVA